VPPQLSHRSTLAHHRQIARNLSLGCLGAHPAARCPGQAPALPEAGTQHRLAPSSLHAGAAPGSNSSANRTLGTTRVLPRPFPSASTGEHAGILAGPSPATPGDPIASPQLFPGAHLRIKGMLVNPKIFQGPERSLVLK
jgi:hypothetical protein